MILKFKDSRNNWKYVQLGDFTVNRLDLTNEIAKILKKFTLEEITSHDATTEIMHLLSKHIKQKTDIYCNTPFYIDWNNIHNLKNAVIVDNTISSMEMYQDNSYGITSFNQSVKHDSTLYVIADECYLMDNNGKTIEKLSNQCN